VKNYSEELLVIDSLFFYKKLNYTTSYPVLPMDIIKCLVDAVFAVTGETVPEGIIRDKKSVLEHFMSAGNLGADIEIIIYKSAFVCLMRLPIILDDHKRNNVRKGALKLHIDTMNAGDLALILFEYTIQLVLCIALKNDSSTKLIKRLTKNADNVLKGVSFAQIKHSKITISKKNMSKLQTQEKLLIRDNNVHEMRDDIVEYDYLGVYDSCVSLRKISYELLNKHINMGPEYVQKACKRILEILKDYKIPAEVVHRKRPSCPEETIKYEKSIIQTQNLVFLKHLATIGSKNVDSLWYHLQSSVGYMAPMSSYRQDYENSVERILMEEIMDKKDYNWNIKTDERVEMRWDGITISGVRTPICKVSETFMQYCGPVVSALSTELSEIVSKKDLSTNHRFIDALKAYPQLIHWENLCWNWEAESIFEKNISETNWKFASANPGLIYFLFRNLGKVDWYWFSMNPAAYRILVEHKDKINPKALSRNYNAIPLIKEIAKTSPDDLDWTFINSNVCAFRILKKYPERIIWPIFCETPFRDPGYVDYLRQNKEKIVWNLLYRNYRAIVLINEHKQILNEGFNSQLTSNAACGNILKEYSDVCCTDCITANPSAVKTIIYLGDILVPDSVCTFEKKEEGFDKLSTNNGIFAINYYLTNEKYFSPDIGHIVSREKYNFLITNYLFENMEYDDPEKWVQIINILTMVFQEQRLDGTFWEGQKITESLEESAKINGKFLISYLNHPTIAMKYLLYHDRIKALHFWPTKKKNPFYAKCYKLHEFDKYESDGDFVIRLANRTYRRILKFAYTKTVDETIKKDMIEKIRPMAHALTRFIMVLIIRTSPKILYSIGVTTITDNNIMVYFEKYIKCMYTGFYGLVLTKYISSLSKVVAPDMEKVLANSFYKNFEANISERKSIHDIVYNVSIDSLLNCTSDLYRQIRRLAPAEIEIKKQICDVVIVIRKKSSTTIKYIREFLEIMNNICSGSNLIIMRCMDIILMAKRHIADKSKKCSQNAKYLHRTNNLTSGLMRLLYNLLSLLENLADDKEFVYGDYLKKYIEVMYHDMETLTTLQEKLSDLFYPLSQQCVHKKHSYCHEVLW